VVKFVAFSSGTEYKDRAVLSKFASLTLDTEEDIARGDNDDDGVERRPLSTQTDYTPQE
jgi:hypothetical protein